MKKTLVIILDKYEYIDKEKDIQKLFSKYNLKFYYCTYENKLIRLVRNIPVLGSRLQHFLYWSKAFLCALKVIIFNKKGNVVLAINPLVGFFTSFLNIFHKYHIFLLGFLFEYKSNKLYYNLRMKFVKSCLKRIDSAITYSNSEVKYYKEIFGVDKFNFLQFGIDYDINFEYKNKELPNAYFFSGGGSNRNYKFFSDFVNKYKDKFDCKFVVATNTRNLYKVDVSNITILKDVNLETFGDVMKKSKCLILCLNDNMLSSGQMVFLQALKLNVPIVVNDIDSVFDYLNDSCAFIYKTNNLESLYEKVIQGMNSNLITENIYYNNFTFLHLMCRVEKFISGVIRNYEN